MIVGTICTIITIWLWQAGHPNLALIVGLIAFGAFIRSDQREQANTQPKTVIDTTPAKVLVEPNEYQDPMYGIGDIRSMLATYPNAHGVPGAGLNHDEAKASMGQQNVSAGIRGEESLAAALIHYGVLDNPNTHVFFSVANPGDATGNTDIDCVIVDGRNVYLLDAKYWAGTGVLHKVGDHTLGAEGKQWSLSRSMPWALSAVSKRNLGQVSAHILLTRTSQGTLGIAEGCDIDSAIHVTTVDEWFATHTFDATSDNRIAISTLTGLMKR